MNDANYAICIADWTKDKSLLQQIRETVFVKEQGVPLELEWDEADEQALHLLALDSARRPIGTARLLSSGQIGRMAVLKTWRKRGVGSALLNQLLAIADQGDYPTLFLNAQQSALPFYARHGFEAEGDIFHEAGIPHQRMTRQKHDG